MVKKLPKFISLAEFDQLVESVRKSKTKNKKEKLLAMHLGFQAGMRLSEIIGLPENISKCCREVIKPVIRQVGDKKYREYTCSKCNKILKTTDFRLSPDKWRIKPLQKKQVDLNSNHIKIEGGKGEKDRIVPCPKKVNKTAVELLPLYPKLQRRNFQIFIRNLCLEVLEKDLSFHAFRHGFGSHLASQNRPLHEIQMLMGHSRLDTTGIYLHANPKKAIEGARDIF